VARGNQRDGRLRMKTTHTIVVRNGAEYRGHVPVLTCWPGNVARFYG